MVPFKAIDKAAIKAKMKPKPEVVRKQNKVEFQGDRTRYTPQNKLDLIRQYDRQKAVNPGLTQKEFCSTRASLKAGTFGKWLPVMERKRIEIDARNPQMWKTALNKPIILFKCVHIKMQVSSYNFLLFLYCEKKSVPMAEFFCELSKRQRNL